MDWGMIGALAGVGALIFAFLQLRKTPASSNSANGDESPNIKPMTIKYVKHRISAETPFKSLSYGDDGYELTREFRIINANILSIKNSENRTINDVKLRYPAPGGLWHFEVAECSTLAKKAVAFSVDDGEFVIRVAEMPANELITFKYFATDVTVLAELRSETGHVVTLWQHNWNALDD